MLYFQAQHLLKKLQLSLHFDTYIYTQMALIKICEVAPSFYIPIKKNDANKTTIPTPKSALLQLAPLFFAFNAEKKVPPIDNSTNNR
jgi:hypothetical protein